MEIGNGKRVKLETSDPVMVSLSALTKVTDAKERALNSVLAGGEGAAATADNSLNNLDLEFWIPNASAMLGKVYSDYQIL